MSIKSTPFGRGARVVDSAKGQGTAPAQVQPQEREARVSPDAMTAVQRADNRLEGAAAAAPPVVPTGDLGYGDAAGATAALPFKAGASGGLSPAGDFSRFLTIADPTDADVAHAGPMLIDYLRTGRYGEFEGVRGVPIRYGVFPPAEGTEVRGVVNLMLGRGGSIAKFSELIFNLRDLRAEGYVIAVADFRGQGFSGREIDGDAGYVRRFSDYVDDQATFTKLLNGWFGKQVPYALIGQSLGGGVTTRYLQAHPGEYRRAIPTAPMTRIHTGLPGAVERVVARAAALVMPNAFVKGARSYQPAATDDTAASSGRNALANYMAAAFPETRLGGPTWEWLAEALRADHQIFETANLEKLRDVDLHIVSARADTTVQPESHDRLAAAVGANLHRLEGAPHELFFTPDAVRKKLVDDIKALLRKPYD